MGATEMSPGGRWMAEIKPVTEDDDGVERSRIGD